MTFDPRQPYNELPSLPPKVDVETKSVLKKAIAANRALAELKGQGGIIPNQAMLVNSLVLQEAKASSEIENIIDDKSEYYLRLRRVTENGEWEAWVLYMLEAVDMTARLTRQRILDIRALLDDALALAKRELPARAYSKELIELLFRQPYTKGQFVVDAGIAERQTAAEYLKELERIGLLKSRKVGKENLYLNVRLYELLAK